MIMRYQMDDGTVVDTDQCAQHWVCNVGSGSGTDPNTFETLYLSRKGRYYIERELLVEGGDVASSSAWFVSPQQAAAWLLEAAKKLEMTID